MKRVRRHRRELRQRIADMFRRPGVCVRCGLVFTSCDCCVYCPGDVDHHAMDCPVETGVFPVTDDLVEHGIMCVDCSVPFADGDYYGYAQAVDDPDVFEVVCLGCIARSELGLNRG